jgi:hypothetical protein
MVTPLPGSIVSGATLVGSEHGWSLDTFPQALTAAERLSYACLGGQFQFRVAGSVREMYWLNADSSERKRGEPWPEYVSRSCREVRDGFTSLVAVTDFSVEAARWSGLADELGRGSDPSGYLVFVAYFVSELEAAKVVSRDGV